MSYKRQTEIAEENGDKFVNENSTPVLVRFSTRNGEDSYKPSYSQEVHTNSTTNFECKACEVGI